MSCRSLFTFFSTGVWHTSCIIILELARDRVVTKGYCDILDLRDSCASLIDQVHLLRPEVKLSPQVTTA